METLKSHRGILILLLIFLILTALYRDAVGRFEGSDELEHFAYVTHLQQEKSLPNFDEDFDSLIRQQVGQAPFYHLTLAAWSSLRPFDWSGNPQRNPWHAYPAPATSTDNRNAFLMNPELNVMSAEQRAMSDSLDWMRLFTPVYGILTILGVYWSALLLWPGQKGWAVFAAMGVAFNPQMIQVFALVGNDAAVTAFGALILAASLAPHHRGLLISTGILMGLAALSKTSGLGLWALPLLAILVEWRKEKYSARVMFSRLLLMGTVALIVCGWWYARNLIAFDDALGIGPHRRMDWALNEPASISSILNRLPLIALSLWANFGSGQIRPHSWGYVMPIAALILSGIGWLRGKQTYEPRRLLLVLPVLIGFIALIQWMREFDLITGRLLFPFYGGFVLLVVTSLRAMGRLRYLIAGGLGASALLMVPLVISPAFGVHFVDDLPQGLQGGPIDFGEARFLGYQVDDRAIFQDEDAQFSLCWTAPSEDDLPVPYAFALHIVGDANHIVGRRESYPGMGTYTLWQANRAFCDDFTLTITEPLEPARAYDISLTLFDVASGESLPASIIGQMRSPAPPVSESEMQGAPFRFGDIHLVDYTLSVDDQSLQLELVWGTQAAVNMDTRLFVHVIASDGDIATQIDPPPGAYPMAMWGGGERIAQSLTVPLDDVFDGVYTVRIGLYDPATFVRLPARDASGEAIPDDAAPVGNFTRR